MKKYLGLIALLVSSSAFADPCVTVSRGIQFYANSYDVNAASSAAVSSCQNVQFTSNYECQNNLRCGFNVGNPYPSGVASCTSTSRNLNFTAQSRDVSQAATSAMAQCQSNPYSSNYECQTTVSCRDASMSMPNQVSCMTSSRNMSFRATGDTNSASQSAVNQCKNNPYTTNYECEANLSCQPTGFAPVPPTYVPGPVAPPVYVPGGGPIAPPVYVPGGGPSYGGGFRCELRIPGFSGPFFGTGGDSEIAASNARASCRQITNDAFTCNRGSAITCARF